MKHLRSALRAPACRAISIMLALSACGDDDVDVREGASSGMLADSAVLAQMRDTVTVGRIIYEAPPDLSLSSARQRRPDIFRPPTPATPPPQRDTTKPARQP
jgi:hypothetical protein